MKKHVLMLTASAFILACSAMAASAQQSPGTPMMQKPDQTRSSSPLIGRAGKVV